jgi:hypothetical protein
MKKLLFAGLVLTAAAAFGALGDVVASFEMGGQGYCYGLTRSSEYLYVVRTYNNQEYIYRLNPSTGSVAGSYPSPNNLGFRGLAYVSDNHLFGTRTVGSTPPWNTAIYNLNAATGSLYTSFTTNAGAYLNYAGLAPRCTGDGGSGTDALFISPDAETQKPISIYSTAGSFIAVFLPARTLENDIAYDWRNGYIWGGGINTEYVVYGITTTGSVAASFDSPMTVWNRGPFAYYGPYLWIARTSGTVYKIHCPSLQPAVSPSSLGRVKAIYR